MNCERYDERLGDYVDGVRDEAFERHLATCPRCQALVSDFTAIRRAASTLEEHVPPPRLWARIASTIETRPRRGAAWAPLALAASLAALLAGGTWLAWQHSVAPPPQQVGAAEAPYEQAIAGLQQLADAQDASLDPQTRAVLKENLLVIDRAIDESRAALADDPANALAQDSLLEALDTKVSLLQDTVALAAEELNQ